MTITADGLLMGGVFLRWFGLLIVLGGLAGALLAGFHARRAQLPGNVWQALVWVTPGAFIGARVWFVLFPPASAVTLGRDAGWLLSNLFDLNQGAVAVWSGGMGWLGALIGSAFGLWLYTRHFKYPFPAWLDGAALGAALGQSVGYLGLGANQELYGRPGPWGVLIEDTTRRIPPYNDLAAYPPDNTYFLPVWLFEALLGLLVLIVLLRLRNRVPPGSLVAWYAVLYGGGRFWLELLRFNVAWLAGIQVAQVTCGALCVLGVVWLARKRGVV